MSLEWKTGAGLGSSTGLGLGLGHGHAYALAGATALGTVLMVTAGALIVVGLISLAARRKKEAGA
jgi:hypothetical protein